jgi:hypothetical protein
MAEKMNKNSKKAQVTIFVILALIIIVGIILLFLFKSPIESTVIDEKNPQSFIDSCVREATEEAIDILSEQGGDIIPLGSTMYESRNISYLCYNANYYIPCVNQKPMLIDHIESEIDDYIKPKVEDCFNLLKSELEQENYEIEIGSMDLTTELKRGQVLVNINRDFKISKGDDVRKFTSFKIKLTHPIYNLAEIALEIAKQEAEYCNFDILGFMIIYPEYNLAKFRPGNSDTIYEIKEVKSGYRFMTAIRSCALPPGF